MSELIQSAKENLGFLAVCLLVFLALYLVAWLFEKYILKTVKQVSSARRISYIAMFTVIAAVLMFFEIPLFFAPSFYEIDFSEVPVMICTFFLGPVAGVTTELAKVILKILLKGTSTAFVGDFANFVVGCSFVLPASIFYHVRKCKGSAIGGMALGTMCMTIFGSMFNAYYLIPKFAQLFGMPLEAIVGMGTAINASVTSVGTLVMFCVLISNSCAASNGFIRAIDCTPVEILGVERGTEQFFVGTKNDLVGGNILFFHIHGGGECQTESFALSYGIANETFVFSKYFIVLVYKITFGEGLSGTAFDETDVIAVRNEADILAVSFPCGNETLLFGDFTHFCFAHGAEREEGASQLFLCEIIQEVGLILAVVEAFLQMTSSVFKADLRIVTCDNIINSEVIHEFKYFTELHMFVAINAGIRGSTVFVCLNKTIDDAGTKLILQIKHLKGNADLFSNAFCIGSIIVGGIIDTVFVVV